MYKLVSSVFHSVLIGVETTGMYTELIKKNEKMPDPRAGSTPVLSGMYAHLCAQVQVTKRYRSIFCGLPRLRKCPGSCTVHCAHRAG